jgi:alpha,alpha-trehalase
MATIDLNCLLYKYETDIAAAIRTHFDGKLTIPDEFCAGHLRPGEEQTPALWDDRAAKRRAAIHAHCWDGARGLFLDYDTAARRRSTYETATSLWALWAGVATAEQAAATVAAGLARFEERGGLAATTLRSRGALGPGRPQRQWDYPFGWAPHQVLAWAGLARYGFAAEAARLAYRWLHMMTRAFVDYNGVVVEKYDVTRETGAHRVDAEYGNQGLDFKGVAKEGYVFPPLLPRTCVSES